MLMYMLLSGGMYVTQNTLSEQIEQVNQQNFSPVHVFLNDLNNIIDAVPNQTGSPPLPVSCNN